MIRLGVYLSILGLVWDPFFILYFSFYSLLYIYLHINFYFHIILFREFVFYFSVDFQKYSQLRHQSEEPWTKVGFSLFRSRHGSHQMALMISWGTCAVHYQLITGQPLQAEEKTRRRRRATISVNVHLIRLHLRTLGEATGLYAHLANRLLSANPGTHDLFRNATLSRPPIVKRTFFKRRALQVKEDSATWATTQVSIFPKDLIRRL